jgi:hypothetical protein
MRRLALAVLLGLPSLGLATLIPDQSNTQTNRTITGAIENGQSFMPSLTGIDFAQFRIAIDGPSQIHLELFSGAGFSGSPIGITPSLTVSCLLTDPNCITTFEFPDTIHLTHGHTYTLALVLDDLSGNSTFRYPALDTDFPLPPGCTPAADCPYPGGIMFSNGGTPFPNIDLYFVEGLSVEAPAVPEPATVALLGAALAGLGFGAHCRRPI